MDPTSPVEEALRQEIGEAVFEVKRSSEYRQWDQAQAEWDARIQGLFTPEEYDLYAWRKAEMNWLLYQAIFKAGMRCMTHIMVYTLPEQMGEER